MEDNNLAYLTAWVLEAKISRFHSLHFYYNRATFNSHSPLATSTQGSGYATNIRVLMQQHPISSNHVLISALGIIF